MEISYTCPYCGAQVLASEQDKNDVPFRPKCGSCGKFFIVSCRTYEQRADCFNGLAEHKWRILPWASELECEVCYERKHVTKCEACGRPFDCMDELDEDYEN